MIFTSYTYWLFLALVFALYWGVRRRSAQNLLILVASYVFYGWVHPWFCILVAASTLADFVAALRMEARPEQKRAWLLLSLAVNLGILGVFKYFHFFVDNAIALAGRAGWDLDPRTTSILLPVGISFYTFQTLSYSIDVYRGKLRARRNLLDFAVFVAFFPQLVAGPIERAGRLLPQIERARAWDADRFAGAFPLILVGLVKKMVVADSVALVVDNVFLLQHPSLTMLALGSLAFTIQIYADFSAYTDIARGSAKLLGFELIRNFNAPYVAVSPSDFWRRWHISLSSWIHDYVYVPLGGSRRESQVACLLVLLVSLGLSGLWHGAAWNFVVWGIYHALLLFTWRSLGIGGRWTPASPWSAAVAWTCMSACTVFGFALFRSSSLAWFVGTFEGVSLLGSKAEQLATLYAACSVALYCLPLLILFPILRPQSRLYPLRSVALGLGLVTLVLFGREQGLDFIYFRF